MAVEKFVERPNLPKGRVKTAILGGGYPEITEALNYLGINTVELPANPAVSDAVKFHADMSAYHRGGNKLIVSRHIYSCIADELASIGIDTIPAEGIQGATYPSDIGLNACEIGKYLFCSAQNTDKAILDSAAKRGKTLVNVNQGYAKCSVCIVDEHNIITADSSIAAAAKNHGITALLIKPGFFQLPGYDYGFIGGSSVKLSRDILAFTGSLEGHENEAQILDFIAKCNVEISYLTSRRCFDIGSIIPITEE